MENQFNAVKIAKIAEVIVDSKEMIIEKLKENGCRITKQRLVLIDIILGNECQSCKEIYYKAVEIDDNIGIATVYRMINALEEIGAINRKLVLTL
jgi:Fur family ferric uptake transcriptional regulator